VYASLYLFTYYTRALVNRYGQLEWELDQRLLGLRLKNWRGHPAQCERIPHPPTAAFDRARWRPGPIVSTTVSPAAGAEGRQPTASNSGDGHVWAHLPLSPPSSSGSGRGGNGEGAFSGYSDAGWPMVEAALARLASSNGVDAASVGATIASAPAYRAAFSEVASGLPPIHGVVVTAVEPNDLVTAHGLVAGLYAQVQTNPLAYRLSSPFTCIRAVITILQHPSHPSIHFSPDYLDT
jgi:hypothetical protein